jgi:hypothetical protein
MSSDFEGFVLAALAAASGYGLWRNGMKVRNLSAGTATSKVASAAKGFVELSGTARALNSEILRDPITHKPCVWYHFETEERKRWGKNSDWRVINSATSVRPFVLDDGTALCAILTLQATIDRRKPEVIKESSTLRHKVWRFCAGDPLYALGHLERLKAGELDTEPSAEATGKPTVQTSYDRAKRINEIAGNLLRSWKTNRTDLIARFDADGSGTVDWHEWEQAQAEARAIAEKQVGAAKVAEVATMPTMQSHEKTQTLDARLSNGAKPSKRGSTSIEFKLERPDDGRPMLVANCTEQEISRRARGRSILGLVLFVGGALYVASAIGSCMQR